MRKLLFLIVLMILPLEAIADNVAMTKTLTYHFTGISNDGLVSSNPWGGDENVFWTEKSGYHYWSTGASAIGAHCNRSDYVYTWSKETYPEVIKKVTVNAGAWSDVSTGLKLNNREVSLKTISSSVYTGKESRIQFDDYVFENVITSDNKGHLLLEYVLSGQADIFIRSITIEYVEGGCDMSEVPTDNAFYAATSFLCERGVLYGSRDDGMFSVEKPLLRKHLANITFRGLFTLKGREIPSKFVSDQYPDIYDDLKSDAPYYQAAKTLLYLDYGDGITPFDRDRDGFFPDGNESRINILKELMEAFNIKPDTEGKNNPFPNDPDIAHLSETSPIKMGYVRQAAKLGIITTENTAFRPYSDCLRGEAFLMLARIIQKIEAGEITDPNPQESDFLDPNSGTGTEDPNANAEPYAALSENNTVLTFYYDDQKTERNGMGVGPFTNSYDRGWSLMSNSITSVVFDASFANCTTLTSTAYWFYGLNISSITGIGNLKTDNVTYMRYMFAWCRSLTNLDLSGFKTDNVTSMYGMFCECSGLTSLNLSGFKTDNVTDMSKMFSGCTSLTSLDVSGFKTDNVTDMTDMFHACLGLTSLDVTGFKTDNVTDMDGMFSDCSGLTSLNLSGFKTNNVTNMSKMFSRCSGLTSLNLSGFKTDNVTSMYCMFSDCSSLTSLDLSGFKTENVTDMGIMFSDCSSLTSLDVRGFKTENVTNMNAMFYGCSGLTSLDVSGFNTSKVTNMSWMFTSCSSLKTIYTDDGWNTAQVQDGEGMFSGCYRLVGGAGTQYDVSHTDHTYARIDGGASNPGYFTAASSEPWQNSDEFEPYAVLTDNDDEITTDEGTNKGKTLTFYYDNQKEDRGGMSVVFSSTADRGWGIECENITKAVFDGSFANCTTLTSTSWWFLFCKNLKTITGITNLKTDNVTNMNGMFYGCSSLTSLDLSSLNTSSLNIMYGIFQDCSSLKSINLTNFKTDNVEDMGQLFLNCSSLESLDVSGFKTDGVTSMFNMFRGCSSLTSLDLSGFNTDNVTNMMLMFDHCSNLKTIYAGEGWSISKVKSSPNVFRDCTNLVGGAGTAYNAQHTDYTYAHIDGGTDNPGYFTAKAGGSGEKREGDLSGDGEVDDADTEVLVSVVMGGDKDKLADADLNHDGKVDAADIVTLVNMIRSQK